MANFEVKIEGLDRLKKAFQNYPSISEPVLQRAIEGAQAVLGKYTLRDNPIPWKTGRLLQSFTFYKGRLWAKWMPTAKYAIFVHEGTGPHGIFPRTKKALAWETGGSSGYATSRSGRKYYKSTQGNMTFSKRVQHPGYRGNPFMPKVISRAQGDINNLFVRALDQINQEIARSTK
jgi:hypothetical protein